MGGEGQPTFFGSLFLAYSSIQWKPFSPATNGQRKSQRINGGCLSFLIRREKDHGGTNRKAGINVTQTGIVNLQMTINRSTKCTSMCFYSSSHSPLHYRRDVFAFILCLILCRGRCISGKRGCFTEILLAFVTF